MFSKTDNVAKAAVFSSKFEIAEPRQQDEQNNHDVKNMVVDSSDTAHPGDIAIRVQNLSKCYQIYDVPRDRLKQFVIPRLQRLAGREAKRYFREFWAVKEVSFEIKKGETFGIIGRNGSGKSTLLQIICGTLSPTGGNVETRGRIAALLELGSGFNPEFTGRENIYMNASVIGLSSAEIDASFDDIVAFADIGEFIEQPVKTYSSGMYVRLAFAVIAHVNADILIIDEALSVGDAFFVQKCMRFLRKFMERGTVLFVSHDIGAVLNLCQAAVWLHKGAVKAIGAPKEVTELYLEKLYEDQQGTNVAHRSEAINNVDRVGLISRPVHDMRLDFINQTNFRNDIKLFSFPQDAPSFGKGGVTIISVRLMDQAERSLTWVVGGEQVSLTIECRANKDIYSPIIGFFLRDRLGQTLIGDNTYLSYIFNPLSVKKGEQFRAAFTFLMPILPVGKYTFSAATAEGTQQDHIQHHWIHDALMVQSVSSSIVSGLIGIPMHLIEMEINN